MWGGDGWRWWRWELCGLRPLFSGSCAGHFRVAGALGFRFYGPLWRSGGVGMVRGHGSQYRRKFGACEGADKEENEERGSGQGGGPVVASRTRALRRSALSRRQPECGRGVSGAQQKVRDAIHRDVGGFEDFQTRASGIEGCCERRGYGRGQAWYKRARKDDCSNARSLAHALREVCGQGLRYPRENLIPPRDFVSRVGRQSTRCDTSSVRRTGRSSSLCKRWNYCVQFSIL